MINTCVVIDRAGQAVCIALMIALAIYAANILLMFADEGLFR